LPSVLQVQETIQQAVRQEAVVVVFVVLPSIVI
jgi:hypothetical protein